MKTSILCFSFSFFSLFFLFVFVVFVFLNRPQISTGTTEKHCTGFWAIHSYQKIRNKRYSNYQGRGKIDSPWDLYSDHVKARQRMLCPHSIRDAERQGSGVQDQPKLHSKKGSGVEVSDNIQSLKDQQDSWYGCVPPRPLLQHTC